MPYGTVLPGQKILAAHKVNIISHIKNLPKSLKVTNGGDDLIELQKAKEKFDAEFNENIISFSQNIAFLESQAKKS